MSKIADTFRAIYKSEDLRKKFILRQRMESQAAQITAAAVMDATL